MEKIGVGFEYRRAGLTFRVIAIMEGLCIASCGSGYEVFKPVVHREGHRWGKWYPAKEGVPGNFRWGYDGLTATSIKGVFDCVTRLKAPSKPPKQPLKGHF